MSKKRKPDSEHDRRDVVRREVKETARGVVVRTEFPGARLKPEPEQQPPLQFVEDVRCRWCKGKKVRCIKKRERDRVYRCFECVDPDTQDWTIFTVGTADGPG